MLWKLKYPHVSENLILIDFISWALWMGGGPAQVFSESEVAMLEQHIRTQMGNMEWQS